MKVLWGNPITLENWERKRERKRVAHIIGITEQLPVGWEGKKIVGSTCSSALCSLLWGATQLLMCPCSAAAARAAVCVCVCVCAYTYVKLFHSYRYPTWNVFNVNDAECSAEVWEASLEAAFVAWWRWNWDCNFATLKSLATSFCCILRGAHTQVYSHKAKAALIKNALTMHCKSRYCTAAGNACRLTKWLYIVLYINSI